MTTTIAPVEAPATPWTLPDTQPELTDADRLEKAASIIEQRGWTQGELLNRQTGAVCAYGALNFVFGEPLLHGDVAWPEDATERATALGEIVEEHLSREVGYWSELTDYNDADGRTGDEVIAAFRRVAAKLRDG